MGDLWITGHVPWEGSSNEGVGYFEFEFSLGSLFSGSPCNCLRVLHDQLHGCWTRGCCILNQNVKLSFPKSSS